MVVVARSNVGCSVSEIQKENKLASWPFQRFNYVLPEASLSNCLMEACVHDCEKLKCRHCTLGIWAYDLVSNSQGSSSNLKYV